ncbi:unnamed protein product [Rodentolepis nana]|uniref:Mediator of RNA polymerase II transcription subunit 11 n=1 Tax=Rodentolepis nana TaxID=102285 RepID=A0A0R3TP76_RODNA|nr:unnamed protein product [Rodentolepis nana]
MNLRDQPLLSIEERLKKLDEIDAKVMQIMESSGGTLDELSKDVPNQKQIEIHTRNFRTAIRDVELELITQLNYLGQVLTGLPFEKNSFETGSSPNNILAEDFAPPSETDESDPVVSSTVNDLELYFAETSCEATELSDSTPCNDLWGVVPTKMAHSSHTTEDDTPDISIHEFEIPEYEFDDEILSLQGDIGRYFIQFLFFAELVGRITPDGLIDEDFEQELGWLNKNARRGDNY